MKNRKNEFHLHVYYTHDKLIKRIKLVKTHLRSIKQSQNRFSVSVYNNNFFFK